MDADAYFATLTAASAAGRFPAVSLDRAAPGVCRYRTPDGRADPAGLLIPPDRYTPALEALPAARAFRGPLADLVPAGLDAGAVARAQYAHDRQVYRVAAGLQPGWDHAQFLADLAAIRSAAAATEVP